MSSVVTECGVFSSPPGLVMILGEEAWDFLVAQRSGVCLYRRGREFDPCSGMRRSPVQALINSLCWCVSGPQSDGTLLAHGVPMMVFARIWTEDGKSPDPASLALGLEEVCFQLSSSGVQTGVSQKSSLLSLFVCNVCQVTWPA